MPGSGAGVGLSVPDGISAPIHLLSHILQFMSSGKTTYQPIACKINQIC
jgi:hypothetical protein